MYVVFLSLPSAKLSVIPIQSVKHMLGFLEGFFYKGNIPGKNHLYTETVLSRVILKVITKYTLLIVSIKTN